MALNRFDTLGDDTLLLILQRLPLVSQLRCGALSRRWRAVLASAPPELFATLRFPAGVRGPDPDALKRLCARAGGVLRVLDLRVLDKPNEARPAAAARGGRRGAKAAEKKDDADKAADKKAPANAVLACPAGALAPMRLAMALEGSGCVALHTLPSPKKLVFSVSVAQFLHQRVPTLSEGSLVVSCDGDDARYLPWLLPGVGKALQLQSYKPPRDRTQLLAQVLARYALTPNACADLLSLDLYYTTCSQYSGAFLAAMLPQCTQLARLDISLSWHVFDVHAPQGEACVPVMRALASMPALRELNVSYSPFGPGDAAALADSLETCETLTKVRASSVQLGAEGAAAFAAMLARRGCTLTELELEGSKLGAQGVAALAGALPRNTSLQRLALARNAAGVEGAEALVAGMAGNATLLRVLAQSNGLRKPEIARFAAATGKRVTW